MKRLTIFAALMFLTTTAFAGTPPENATGVQAKGTGFPLHLNSRERGEIARLMVYKWAGQARREGLDLHTWAVELGRKVGVSDSLNVYQAAGMPSYEWAMSALQGQPRSDRTAAKIGDAAADLVYTPLPNGRCRVADSRAIGAAPGSPLSPFVERNIDVENVVSYASQGGSGSTLGNGSTNCGLPDNAGAYAVSLTILPPAGVASGLLKVYEKGKLWTEGNPVLFTTNDFGASNDVIVKSCQSCAVELAVQSGSAVHYVVDIMGYFAPPIATELQCAGTANAIVSVAAGATVTAIAPACPTGYTQTATNCDTTSDTVGLLSVANGSCRARSADTVPQELRASRTCCRVPGR